MAIINFSREATTRAEAIEKAKNIRVEAVLADNEFRFGLGAQFQGYRNETRKLFVVLV